MEPTNVRLKGVNVYADLDLDLSRLPPGLIALSGRNGGGKTTLMEAMLPAPLLLAFPSRTGPLYRRVKPGSRDNVLETTIRHNGADYRLHVKIDAGTGRSGQRIDAFVYRDGVPVPGTEKGDQEAYREALAAIFPEPSLILASSFSTQNGAGDILRMKREERRALFARLLNLGDLEALAERAAGRRKHADELIRQADAALRDLQAEVERMAGTEDELAAATASVRDAVDALARRTKERAAFADAASRARAAADEARRLFDAHAAAVRGAEGQLSGAREEEERLRGRVAVLEERAMGLDAARDAAAGLPALREDLAAARAARQELAGAYRQADGEVRQAEEAVSQRPTRSGPTYDAAVADAEARHRLRAQEAEAVRDRAALTAAEARLRDARAALQAAGDPERDLDRARARIEALRTTAGLLERVPCGGRVLVHVAVESAEGVPVDYDDVDCGSCGLLGAATKARADLPAEEDRVPVLEAAVLALVQLRAAEQEAVAEEAAARIAWDRAERARGDLPALDRALADAQELRTAAAARRKAAEEAEAQIPALQGARDAISRAGEEKARDIARLVDRLREREEADTALRKLEQDLAGLPALREALTVAERATAAARARLEDLQAAPAASPDEAEARARQAEEDLLPWTSAWEEATRALEAARATRDRLQGRLEELTARRTRYEAAAARRTALAARRAAFALVERGFGREGIQALEIDAAGPRVSALANELLGATFGGRFSIRLITSRPSADGKKLNEVFEIEVPDGLYGVARTPEDLSGGERVIISEAIKLAIAIYNSERNGVTSDTLWRDECDGALDEEAAAAYAPMLRRALELGGFRRCYFISHRPDVIAQADAVLRCESGRVEVEIR